MACAACHYNGPLPAGGGAGPARRGARGLPDRRAPPPALGGAAAEAGHGVAAARAAPCRVRARVGAHHPARRAHHAGGLGQPRHRGEPRHRRHGGGGVARHRRDRRGRARGHAQQSSGGSREACAARPPAAPGEPAACHVCGAPLGAGDGAIARCGFCRRRQPGRRGRPRAGARAPGRDPAVVRAGRERRARLFGRATSGAAAVVVATALAVPVASFVLGVTVTLVGESRRLPVDAAVTYAVVGTPLGQCIGRACQERTAARRCGSAVPARRAARGAGDRAGSSDRGRVARIPRQPLRDGEAGGRRRSGGVLVAAHGQLRRGPARGWDVVHEQHRRAVPERPAAEVIRACFAPRPAMGIERSIAVDRRMPRALRDCGQRSNRGARAAFGRRSSAWRAWRARRGAGAHRGAARRKLAVPCRRPPRIVGGVGWG